ncbi:MAG: hypothetical protein IPO83_09400 [Chitinophagaceae bacterium]|nr:hypothetical protein [Chitinophagaceae bacterium]
MEENIFSHENEDSLNPEYNEQLRMENELLKLKIHAQYGGIPGSESSSNLPPEIENEFLKNVIAFEEQYHREHPPVKISTYLGNPVFKKSAELNDDEFEVESHRLAALMKSNCIFVDFIRERDDRFQYSFITEEFFDHETEFTVDIPGMMHCFIYEEFHPDHEMDIENRTEDFMQAWAKGDTEFANHYLASEFIQPDRIVLSLKELIIKLRRFFNSYRIIENFDYEILEIKFQLDPKNKPQGLGHAEGLVKYDAILESGERKSFEGPFKLYMALEYGWWSIVYFVMEGYN